MTSLLSTSPICAWLERGESPAGQRLIAQRLLIVGESADEVAAELQSEGAAVAATSIAEVDQSIAGAIAEFGGIDALVTLVDSASDDGALHELDPLEWQAGLDRHLSSAFLANRAAVCYFLERRQPGAIVNAIRITGAGGCLDAATLGGVLALTRASAVRYAGQRIRVNALVPPAVGGPDAADFADALAFLCDASGALVTGAVLPVVF